MDEYLFKANDKNIRATDANLEQALTHELSEFYKILFVFRAIAIHKHVKCIALQQ